MCKRLGRTLFWVGVCAFLGAMGCGSPSTGREEPEGLQQSRQSLVSGPDLFVKAVSTPASVQPFGSLTATLTVCNQGTVGELVSADIVLSADKVISSSDPVYVTANYLGEVAPGECQPFQVEAYSSWPEGDWYVGAIVRTYYAPDINPANDASAGTLFHVGTLPDYLIPSLTGPANVKPGEPFTVDVKVCNRGSVAGATDVQLVLSADASIRYSPSDPPAKQDLPLIAFTSGMLEPGQCETQQLPLNVQPPQEGTWYLGAVADPASSALEFVETNNTRASKPMGIATRPDFALPTVTAPGIVGPGQPFTVDVKVCNQGTSGGATPVQLVLSEDTTILAQDLPLTSFISGALEPGQCETRQVQTAVQPPQEGIWYVGAIADPANSTLEILENNNTRASKAVGIGTQPDFLIQAVTGLPSVTPGAPLSVDVTLCNQGTTGGSTAVQLVLSEDTSILVQDLPLASFSSGLLAPGKCETRQVQTVVQPPQEGAWYVGAIADPSNTTLEILETNNTRAGKRMNVGHMPDFIVQSVSGPVTTQRGYYFQVKATVCNQGTVGDYPAVEIFLSSDKVITRGDSGIAYFTPGWVAPGECVSGMAEAAPYLDADGDWYLGAIVSGSIPEFDTTNNARAGSVLHVGFYPDYLIQEVSGPISVKPGDPFTASVTVCNQGTADGGTDVALVLSQDTTLSQEQDLPLRSFSSGPLAAKECKTHQVQASAPSSHDGAWYLGAIADPGNAELEFFETNNTRTGSVLGIGHLPDFTLQAVSAPASLEPGAPFLASVTVCNQGTVSGTTSVRLVLSEDTTILAQDLPLASFSSGNVAPGQCATQQVQALAQAPHEGTWYLGAIANPDHTQQEFLETNNTRASKPVGIGYRPDFLIQAISGPPSVFPGTPFTVEVKVCNQGTLAGGTDVQLLLSENSSIRQDQDPPLHTFASGVLAPGQCKTYYPELSVQPPHEGAWYLGAVADLGNSTPEFSETNNTRVSKSIGMGYMPDFIVQALPAFVDFARYGNAIVHPVTLCNQGTTGGILTVQFYLSADKDITPLDMPTTSSHIGWLEAGACYSDTYSSDGWGLEGAWYVGAIVSSYDGLEFDTSNNARASAPLHLGSKPDFLIQKLSAPSVVKPGDRVTTSVTVCNQGSVPGGTEVALVLSQDTTLSQAEDLPWVSIFSGTLAQGECREQQIQVLAQPFQEGTWYLGAIADPGNAEPELIETNNTRTGSRIGIGLLPDFIIQAVSGPPIVKPGAPFEASVTVCNQGTVSGTTPVRLVLSEDTTILAQDLPLTSFSSGALAPGQCKTQQVQALAQAPHEGTWYLGAIANPDHTQQEFLETNNTRASKPVGIGYRPDFLIQAVTGPASIQPGQPFLASATVCNQGLVAGDTDVQLVLSENTSILFPDDGPPAKRDLPLASFFSGPLAPGQCTTRQVQAITPVPHDGVWYLGAVADPYDATWELVETNNTRASKALGAGNAPDLVIVDVRRLSVVYPYSWEALSFTACNQGTVSSGFASVYLMLSKDTDIRFTPNAPPESWEDQDAVSVYWGVGPLAPGECRTEQIESYSPSWDMEPRYLGALIDPYNEMPELIETNNTRLGSLLGFGFGGDFVIQSVSGPSSLQPGEAFTASVTVCNQSIHKDWLPSTEVQLVFSEDASIRFSPLDPPEEQDLPLVSFALGSLEAGHCATKQVQAVAQVPHEGIWYLGAVADPANTEQEPLETNNSRASKPMGIGHLPDYVIQSVSSSVPSITPGEPLTASVTVCNQGTTGGSGADVRVVLSEDTTLRLSSSDPLEAVDLPLTSFPSGPLAPGQCMTQQAQLSPQAPHEGTWHLGAVVDLDNTTPEFSELNNTRFSKPFGIGHRPDFIVQAVSGPPSALPEAPFTASVTACNQGTLGGSAQVTLVLSMDTAIHFSSISPELGDRPLASFSTGLLAPGQCTTQPVQASAQGPYEGAWYLGAVADPGQLEQELLESNNASASARIALGHGPVLVIPELSAPSTVTMGEPYEATFKVCNQGTAASAASVSLVYSDDTDIRISYADPPETQEVQVLVYFLETLEPGQCAEQTAFLSVPPPHEGDWYLGALAYPYDPIYWAPPDLIGTTNTRASGLIHFQP